MVQAIVKLCGWTKGFLHATYRQVQDAELSLYDN